MCGSYVLFAFPIERGSAHLVNLKVRDAPEGDPTHKECAVKPEKTNGEQGPDERTERSRRRPGELGSLDVWARSAPIRLAGYEEDLAEPHILPSVD
ncbi:hypothetical protein HEK131_36220 [Streptomyces seoulensis]|nr:hypothetical protein HEK131_36220 [Streptomyces seoulensis]